MNKEFQKGYLYCIAGRPGMGKTTLAKRIVMDLKDKEFTVFSLEMYKEKFIKGLEKCSNITLYDNVITIDEIEVIVKSKKTDIVIIDYFQLIQCAGNSLEEKHTMISGRLKRLAAESETAIIVITQLNRSIELRDNKRPVLSDFDNTSYSNIQKVADAILFLYDEHYYDSNKPHTKEIIITKNQKGNCESVFLPYEANKEF